MIDKRIPTLATEKVDGTRPNQDLTKTKTQPRPNQKKVNVDGSIPIVPLFFAASFFCFGIVPLIDIGLAPISLNWVPDHLKYLAQLPIDGNIFVASPTRMGLFRLQT